MKPVFEGILLALGLIIPLGTQNVFVLNNGILSKHFFSTLPVVITAILCDFLLVLMSILGLSLVIQQSDIAKIVIMSLGVIFLMRFGYISWCSSGLENNSEKSVYANSLLRQIIYTCSVSILNPHAILDVFFVIGPASLQFYGFEKVLFLTGCFIVEVLWFSGLSFFGVSIRDFSQNLNYRKKVMKFSQKISAIIVFGVAIYMIQDLYLVLSNYSFNF
ncbi:MAG: LysE/ArgO family amino acid transporter [Gammaproteobacteria bacterium]